VQVVRERDEGAVLVAVEPQDAFEGGDEGRPFLSRGERAGRDQGEPAGDLVTSRAGQQCPAVQADARVDEFSELRHAGTGLFLYRISVFPHP
jgi:hypothetical protein